jgi:hypothetical protein
MKIRIGGPFPLRFDLTRLMFAGILVGGLGVLIAGAVLIGLLPPWDAHLAGGLRWGDLGLGVTLLGMALYFLGRIVQIYEFLRRRR